MIVVASSVLVAIGQEEADADLYLETLENADHATISPVNAVEAGLVLIGRRIIQHSRAYDRWLGILGVEIHRDLIDHVAALEAYLEFGRGYRPAKLNFGNCFAYALAKQLKAPLLYKGRDFAQTDITSALQPT